jgi:hypothetical protein
MLAQRLIVLNNFSQHARHCSENSDSWYWDKPSVIDGCQNSSR